MPSAASKLDKPVLVPDVPESLKQALTVVEKKVRNLEKRKGKLDQILEQSKAGKELNEDQQQAIKRYDEVLRQLDLVRDLHKQFTQISTDSAKQLKKQAKREALERQQYEISRYRELLRIQDLLTNLGADNVREDFLAGKNNACLLTEENLDLLDELYKLICPSRETESDTPFSEQLSVAAEHICNLLDAKPKEVLGTTYKELHDLLQLISNSKYFSEGSTDDKEKEDEPEDEGKDDPSESQDPPPPKPSGDSDDESGDGDKSGHGESTEYGEFIMVKQDDVSTQQASVTQPCSATTIQPVLTQHSAQELQEQESCYFAEQQNYEQRIRPISEVISVVQGGYNFLQESQIDFESPHMDPAVVAAHPMAPPPPQIVTDAPTYHNAVYQQAVTDTTYAPQSSYEQQSDINAPVESLTFTNTAYIASGSPNYGNNLAYSQASKLGQVSHTLIEGQDIPDAPPPIPLPSQLSPETSTLNVNAVSFKSTSYQDENSQVLENEYNNSVVTGKEPVMQNISSPQQRTNDGDDDEQAPGGYPHQKGPVSVANVRGRGSRGGNIAYSGRGSYRGGDASYRNNIGRHQSPSYNTENGFQHRTSGNSGSSRPAPRGNRGGSMRGNRGAFNQRYQQPQGASA